MLRKLKLFDQNYHWVGEKVLPARPYDICNVTDNEIAVTFPREKRIHVFTGMIHSLNLYLRQCFIVMLSLYALLSNPVQFQGIIQFR